MIFTHTLPILPPNLFSFWKILHKNPNHGYFLGSGASTQEDHILYLSMDEPTSVYEKSINALEKEAKKENGLPLPRMVGWFSFEAGRFFDDGIFRLAKIPSIFNLPPFSFGLYDHTVKMDTLKKSMTLIQWGSSSREKFNQRVKQIHGALQQSLINEKRHPSRTSRAIKNRFKHMGLEEFSHMVRSAKEAIRCGDIYQANLSIRFQSEYKKDPVGFYQSLCRKNPSPYACCLKHPKGWILSSSPELLLTVEKGTLATRPIAGTRPRGKNKKLDQVRQGQLLLSPKEKAEHIMLVDLERNDLGRVAVPGSVYVSEKFIIERYSHVMHIVSEVRAKLRKNKTAFDAVRAVFPGGTITGCPKIRSIEIINNLEKSARDPFYGSAGYFTGDGGAKLNILIRTALIKNKKIYLQAGAGIVADSHPTREFKEVLAKAQALLESAF